MYQFKRKEKAKQLYLEIEELFRVITFFFLQRVMIFERTKVIINLLRKWYYVSGVESYNVTKNQQRVTVTGHIDANEILDEVRSTGKTADMWSLVPYNLVAYPYAIGAYDMKAPTGFVRGVPQAVGDPKSPELKMMALFNDDNANACSIM